MKLFKTIFSQRDCCTYREALEKLNHVKRLLETPAYKQIYITEFHD